MANERTSRWRALAEVLRPDAWRWLGLGGCVAVVAALAVVGPLVVRAIVDRAADGATASEIGRLGLLFLAIAVLGQILTVTVAWIATLAAWRTTNGLRLRMTEHVLGLDHEFHRRHTPGELIQRVDGDITSVSDFLGLVVPKALGALLTVVGMVVVLGVLDWRLAIGMLVYLMAAVSVTIRSRHRAVSESGDEMGSLARLYGGIEERLTASEDLRANGAADHVAWRFIEDSSDAFSSGLRRERAFLLMWWFVQSAIVAGWLLVLIAGAFLVSADVITVGTAFLMFQYVLLIARPLEDVVHQLETVQKANGAMVRVIDLLGLTSKIVDDGTVRPPAGPLSLDVDSLDFDYGDDQPVLRGVTLAIPAGASIGVVGRTGSGKTTLSRILLRLVEPTSGSVRLGGVEIADIPLADLRHRVAMVPQEVELFAGSVRENVTLFDDEPSDADVVSALTEVGLDGLVAGGIDRPLGAGGTGLSAGQAQLLALARVWLRGADLVVLDEATARIDPETERRLEDAVARLMADRTTVVIAHRLSTLRRVDFIVVLDHGRVIEFGPRHELVRDDGSRFAQLLSLSGEVELDGAVS